MQVTHKLIEQALEAYGNDHKITYSDDGKRYLVMRENMPDVQICEKDGKLRSTDTDFGLVLTEYLHDLTKPSLLPQEDQKKIEELKQSRTPANRQASKPAPIQGNEVDDWRANQDRAYSVAGKKVPNAFGASEQANKRGLCTQIIDSGRTKDLAWGHVRVTDPVTGQYREDRVSHEKETFCLLKSWEDANKQATYQQKGQPSLIIGILDNNLPELNPDVKIKGMPAPLWLTMQVMRAWSFADRDAITKAERRAQLKILNREWREKEEIQLEEEEGRAVQESRRATA